MTTDNHRFQRVVKPAANYYASRLKIPFGNHLPHKKYGRQHIEIAKKGQRRELNSGESEEEDDEAKEKIGGSALCNGGAKGPLVAVANGTPPSMGPSLAPPPPLPRSRSLETLKREFQLGDVLDFLKAAGQAIVEDEVTQRFEAEELRSWNLLTRTNRWYEFISWRLSVIWVLGFFMRYCFLLPLRVLICFIGVAWAVFSMAMLGFLPPSPLKRWLHKRAFFITFRILARSLSMVLTYHNIQYRPDRGGVCVANHTSPIDIVAVSTESCFSLVSPRVVPGRLDGRGFGGAVS